MEEDWISHETTTHQDHVIAHVVGATVLAYFIADEVAYLLLDIGFIWIVYLDGEMGLVPQSMAISELEIDDDTRIKLRDDVRHLEQEDKEQPLKIFTVAPIGCLIIDVGFQSKDEERRLLINCEEASITIETSLYSREVRVQIN